MQNTGDTGLFSPLPLTLEMIIPKAKSRFQCPAAIKYNDSTPHTLSPLRKSYWLASPNTNKVYCDLAEETL